MEGETTDVESVVTEKSNTESELSSNYGKLKHSDSLLLLTQVSLGVCCVAEISPNFTNYSSQNLLKVLAEKIIGGEKGFSPPIQRKYNEMGLTLYIVQVKDDDEEEVMVVDWTMVKVSVVADNGAVVMDVVVVVIEVVVAWTVVVVVGMVEGAVYSQEEGEGAGKEEQAQELKHLTVEHIAKIYTQLVVLFYLTFCIASQMSNMNDHTSRP